MPSRKTRTSEKQMMPMERDIHAIRVVITIAIPVVVALILYFVNWSLDIRTGVKNIGKALVLLADDQNKKAIELLLTRAKPTKIEKLDEEAIAWIRGHPEELDRGTIKLIAESYVKVAREREDFARKIDELDGQRVSLSNKLTNMSTEVEGYEETLLEQTRTIAQQRKNIEQITKENSELNKNIASLEVANTNLTNRIASLRTTNAELERVSAEQNQTIKQITHNFFQVTGELNGKLDSLTAQGASLKGTNAEQAQTIKHITDNFFKVTGGLNQKVASLDKINAEQQKTIEEQKEAVKRLNEEIGRLERRIKEMENLEKLKRGIERED